MKQLFFTSIFSLLAFFASAQILDDYLLDSIHIERDIQGNVIFSSSKYEYDNQNRIITHRRDADYTLFSYFDDSRVAEVIQIEDDLLLFRQIDSLNVDGFVTLRSNYTPENNFESPTALFRNILDGDNRILSSSNFSLFNNELVLRRKSVNAYDDMGRIVTDSTYFYESNGELLAFRSTVLVYSDLGPDYSVSSTGVTPSEISSLDSLYYSYDQGVLSSLLLKGYFDSNLQECERQKFTFDTNTQTSLISIADPSLGCPTYLPRQKTVTYLSENENLEADSVLVFSIMNNQDILGRETRFELSDFDEDMMKLVQTVNTLEDFDGSQLNYVDTRIYKERTVVGIENEEDHSAKLLISPNLAQSGSPITIASDFEFDQIRIYDEVGQLVVQIPAQHGQLISILAPMKAGTYFVFAAEGNRMVSEAGKLIIID